jgi:predicted metal-binding protein
MVVQDTFGKIFNEGTEFQRDGSQFDALFKDGDTYNGRRCRLSPCTRPATRRPA